MKKTIGVTGMMCGHCEATVQKALEALPQVESAKADHTNNTVVIDISGEINNDIIKDTIENAGYQVTDIR